MKTLILYLSVHHGNTKKIADALAKILHAKVAKPNAIKTLASYDIIGFGSGIYFWRHHPSLLKYIDSLPQQKNKKAFVFSTAGIKAYRCTLMHHALKKRLVRKGFTIVGEFACVGFDTYGLLKICGGLNKGRPNQQDIEHAQEFARDLQKKLQA